MKRFIPLLILLLAAILLAVLPLGPPSPQLPEIEAKDGSQIAYLRQLELGLQFEMRGKYELAQSAYEQAALAEQEEIAKAALNGIRRSLTYQRNTVLGLQAQLRLIAKSLLENLLPLLLVLALVYGFWQVLSRPLTRPGYLILPFEDHTTGKLGAGLPSLLNFFIREATFAHVQKQSQLLGLATLEFPLVSTLSDTQDTLAEAFTSIESLNLGGIDLPFGKLIAAIRQRLNLRQFTLTGALHQHGDTIRLYAELRETATQIILQSWQLYSQRGEIPEQTEAVVEELAYRFLHQVISASQEPSQKVTIESQSWRSLRYFTQGLLLLQRDPTPGLIEDLNKARTLFSQAVEVDPGFTTAEYALGITCTRLGLFSQARSAFQEVIERDEQFVTEATYNMGLAYYYEFRPWAYERASECFQDVLSRLFVTGKASESQKVDQAHMLLEALSYAGLANIAAQYIGEELENRPATTDEPPNGESRPMSNQELMHSVQLNYQAAQQIIQTLNQGPQTRIVRALLENALGIANYYAGQPQKARNHLKAATRYYPENPVAYGYIALSLLDDKISGAAHEWLERALEWNPAPQYQEYLYYKFGRYYQRNGELRKANESYFKAPNLHRAVNYAGEVLLELEDPEDAVEMFRKATQANSKVGNYWMNLAGGLLHAYPEEEEAINEAVVAATRATQLNSNDWQAQDMLGQAYLANGVLDRALRAFQDSINLNDKIVQNRFHLAFVHHKRGSPARAIQEIDIAFATPDPNPTWRQRAAALKQQLVSQGTDSIPTEPESA
ncbi:MAG: tetratricopeptide repeat protein [Anaerolineales bacterium]|nr:MAG: tetratricopeptide repeat protein [Anaerolineales bacterium]